MGPVVAVDEDVRIIPFCIPLDASDYDNIVGGSSSAPSSFGIVGIVTLRGRSAVVWFGWGGIEKTTGDGDDHDDGGGVVTTTTTTENEDVVLSIVVGNGRPPMGPLALSMPPRNVRGVDDAAAVASSTQLLGGSSEDDMILGHQISARLARRIGWPIFVSCSLCGWGGDQGAEGGGGGGGGVAASSSMSPAASAGYDENSQRRAAALAEREASRILLQEKERLSGMS
jgi:hypothetical protein